ncbi:hypothetical protein [Microcoleus vaginatus]|uniref:hypothetical protein n=1 Tax=Microcoleus vaginatus TaxID=119532 RepID=UPI00020D143A|nr:hypothetical protein MicvaDRAFT_2926 [Microcoleus vaginatus FGP-2]
MYIGETLCSVGRLGNLFFQTVDASTGFLHEPTTSDGEGYRLKNRVFRLIRTSTTVIRAIAPQQVSEKTTMSES